MKKSTMIAIAKELFDGCSREDNPEYLRGMSELIANCFPVKNTDSGDMSEMVMLEILNNERN